MDIKKILRAAWFTPGSKGRWGLPLIFTGKPGGSKTAQIEAEAKSYGMACETFIGSIREPTDIGGLGRLFDDCFRAQPPGWARDLAEKTPRAVLFLDELNTNVPSMQAAMLRVLTDGAIGELILPPTVRISAAMNPVEEAANGWDLAPPLANRFGHLNFELPSVANWSNWLLGGDESGAADSNSKAPSAERLEAEVEKRFPSEFAKAKGLVTAFLKANPGLMHRMPSPGPEASRPWPSHRTWELATRAVAGAAVHDLDASNTEELVAAFIGIGPAAEFYKYMADADLPDPEVVLDGKVKFKHDPRRLDRTSAVLAACAAVTTSKETEKGKQKARAEALWGIITDVMDAGATDCTVQAGMALAKAGLINTGKKAFEALGKIQPVLAAAGFDAKNQ